MMAQNSQVATFAISPGTPLVPRTNRPEKLQRGAGRRSLPEEDAE